ncbi:hypothetical protein K491DRAFT_592616 [Lophiostoma macrostomum CBS 122681]|uniref:RING-type E3 ubiquitin transferase n=1 Tax=Lophiostoma macrostomum CBS 122681 TaxID=1314788 RepID=A0A6A6TFA1_9PLEO|nr:hypothetical protein K491DRAFT_592616 [Lophiostoma macrostomum CBS 122681]
MSPSAPPGPGRPSQQAAFTHRANNEPQPEPQHHFLDHIINQTSRDHSQQQQSPLAGSYFEDAYRDSPSPPLRYLDTVLNPLHNEPGSLPFGYRQQPSPPQRSWRNRSPPFQYLPTFDPPAMAPSSPARPWNNGYVDLTREDSDLFAPEGFPVAPPTPQRRPKRPTPSPGPSSKRVRRADGTAANVKSRSPEAKIEEIDLSEDRPVLQDVLQKQREQAIKAQQKPEEQATTLRNFTCVICMDTPTDLTATSCGHLFCHTCLMEALIAGENRSGPNEPKRSQCPVCRKHINRTKQPDIIPLLLKKALASQPRRSSRPPQQPKVT